MSRLNSQTLKSWLQTMRGCRPPVSKV
jgi:hypothetical protein